MSKAVNRAAIAGDAATEPCTTPTLRDLGRAEDSTNTAKVPPVLPVPATRMKGGKAA
jgi:hypothetical protein